MPAALKLGDRVSFMVEERLLSSSKWQQEPKAGAPVWATEVQVVPRAVAYEGVGDGEDRELWELPEVVEVEPEVVAGAPAVPPEAKAKALEPPLPADWKRCYSRTSGEASQKECSMIS